MRVKYNTDENNIQHNYKILPQLNLGIYENFLVTMT